MKGEIHSHLLHMEAGGKVPVHTHKGYELTLCYWQEILAMIWVTTHPGDFILLDGQHQHQPYSERWLFVFNRG